MKKAIKIEGMSCEHCVNHVTEALTELHGVKKVDVNLSAGRAVIETEGEVEDKAIKTAISEVGYEVLSIENA